MRCPDCSHPNLPGEELCESCGAHLLVDRAGADQRKILEGSLRLLKPHPAVTASAKDSVAHAILLMRRQKIGCVLILESGMPAGLFTERDLLRRIAGVKPPARVMLKDAMKPSPHCLTEDDSVAFAFHFMAIHECRHIPIRRADGSYGMISSRDLLAYLCR